MNFPRSNSLCVFIDLEKAYDIDRVPREELYWCMRSKEVLEKYLRLVKDMYSREKQSLNVQQGPATHRGLHQGSVLSLSPFLFSIMHVLTDDVRKSAPWQMLFADDVVLSAEERKELEGEMEKCPEKRGMKLI